MNKAQLTALAGLVQALREPHSAITREEVANVLDKVLKASEPKVAASKRFKKPAPEEVEEYGFSIGFRVDGQVFCDFYESKGWMVGKSPMKDWKAAVRTWKRSPHNAHLVTGLVRCKCGQPATIKVRPKGMTVSINMCAKCGKGK